MFSYLVKCNPAKLEPESDRFPYVECSLGIGTFLKDSGSDIINKF